MASRSPALTYGAAARGRGEIWTWGRLELPGLRTYQSRNTLTWFVENLTARSSFLQSLINRETLTVWPLW